MNPSTVLRTATVLVSCTTASLAAAQDMKVGVGRQVITPEKPMWLAGYASRIAPSEGKVHDLWAKALAFEDETGARAVIVTTDLLTMPAVLAHAVAAQVQERWNIPRERLMLTASHTHCSPVIQDGLVNMYGLDETQAALVGEYSEGLRVLIAASIEQALQNLEPCLLTWGVGEANFAGNRRKYTLDGVTNDFNPIGVVDHDVPVLLAKRSDGSPKALLFGYACHNTTLSFQLFCGDYAGFAQLAVEKAFPGCTAMFAAGCGGDQNPYPRRELALAEQHGKSLAAAVESAIQADMAVVKGPIRAAYKEIPLALSEPPTHAMLEEQLKSEDKYVSRRAQALLEKLDTAGQLETSYPYPIQV
ncbi:MAG: neutral/alkaline non-lysosomal ceramidase N-terminal domain-containing protein, partial [Candidatus Hydrogenedentes bacterium]|nr:neutral/alkaline non-lysosomal ceramidase N-terminal domain-containing protein [Candidatus Hydrogenedentota bacterium]